MLPRDLRTNAGGTFDVTCGKCLASSPHVPAESPEDAWTKLTREGWTVTETRAARYATCPRCSAHPMTIEEAVARAHKSRKRR